MLENVFLEVKDCLGICDGVMRGHGNRVRVKSY